MKFASRVKELEQKLQDNEKLLSTYAEDLEEQIEHLKGDYIELLNRQASYRNELSMLEEQFQQQNSKNQRLDEENAKYVQMRMQISTKKAKLVENYEQVKEKIANTITNIQRRKLRLETAKRNIVKMKRNCTKRINLFSRLVPEKKC